MTKTSAKNDKILRQKIILFLHSGNRGKKFWVHFSLTIVQTNLHKASAERKIYQQRF